MHSWQAPLTHHRQSRASAHLLLHGLQHLQPAAVQAAPVDGAVGGADPVQPVGRVVQGKTWGQRSGERTRYIRLTEGGALTGREPIRGLEKWYDKTMV